MSTPPVQREIMLYAALAVKPEGRLMLFDPKEGDAHFPIAFSQEPPVDEKFPQGSVRFGLGIEFGDEQPQFREHHQRLLQQYPVGHLLEEYDRNALTLEGLIGEVEALTGLTSYNKGSRQPDGARWVRMKHTLPAAAPVPLEVDF